MCEISPFLSEKKPELARDGALCGLRQTWWEHQENQHNDLKITVHCSFLSCATELKKCARRAGMKSWETCSLAVCITSDVYTTSWDKGWNKIFPLVFKKYGWTTQVNCTLLIILHHVCIGWASESHMVIVATGCLVCKLQKTYLNKWHKDICDSDITWLLCQTNRWTTEPSTEQFQQCPYTHTHTRHPQLGRVTCGWMKMMRFFMQRVLYKIS